MDENIKDDEVIEPSHNFWNYEYRHYLRGLFPSEAQQIIKEKWLENGLELTDVSDKHEEIIDEVYNYGIHNPIDKFDENNFLVLKNIPIEYQQRLVNSALSEIEAEGESDYDKNVLDAVADRQSKMKIKEKFGAGFLGGVDTVLWDRTVEEDGDYKRVGVIIKGICKLEPDYENDVQAIDFARSMGAKKFEYKENIKNNLHSSIQGLFSDLSEIKDYDAYNSVLNTIVSTIEEGNLTYYYQHDVEESEKKLGELRQDYIKKSVDDTLQNHSDDIEKLNEVYEDLSEKADDWSDESYFEKDLDRLQDRVIDLETEEYNKFNYIMLSRLQTDVKQFFKEGNWGYMREESLWAGNMKDQIAEMKKQYNLIKIKPEWCSMKDIETYEKKYSITKISDNDEEPVDVKLKDLTEDYINKMGFWIDSDNNEGGYVIDKVRVKINDADYVLDTTRKNIKVYEYFNHNNELPFTSKQDVWENFIEPEQKKIYEAQNLIQIDTPFTPTEYDKKLREKYPELTKKQSSSVAFCAVNGHLPIEIAGNNVLIDNIDKNKLMSVKKDGEIEDVVLKDNLLTIQNENGDKFNVKLVLKSNEYGLNNCLAHEKDMPLVEFYDNEYKHTDLGQFVSRYGADTLLGKDGFVKEPHRDGLCLDGGVSKWTIDTEQMNKVIDWLENHPKVQEVIHQKEWAGLVKEAKKEQKTTQDMV